MRVGIFDSGIGGLTVLGEAIKALPDADFLYYADTFYAPYGTKDKAFVKARVLDIAKYLSAFELDALVVACNTATSIAVKALRSMYDFPIIGMEPAVKYGLDHFKGKRILVMATDLTLKEDKYHDLLDTYDINHRVDSLPMPGLVEFAEKRIYDGNEVVTYIKEALANYELLAYDAIVLGCTHFIFFRDLIQSLVPDSVQVIDGNAGTVRQLKRRLESVKGHHSHGQIQYFTSTASGVLVADFSDVIQKQ